MPSTPEMLQSELDAIRLGLTRLPLASIAVINATTVLTDAEVAPVVMALQTQVSRDFAPIWGRNARLTLIPRGSTPPLGSWWLTLLDDSNMANALGYHDITSEGLPLGKVFVKTTQGAGDQWSVTASHELLEMLADPEINLVVFDQMTASGGRLYAVEVGDPCEADILGYDISGVLVSDFITPAWFGTGSSGPFDFQGHIMGPLQILPDGYASVLDISSGDGWQQINGKQGNIRARAAVGSRRERRRTPRIDWIGSHLTPAPPRHHDALEEVLELLRVVNRKADTIMASDTEMQAALDKIKAAQQAVADRITALISTIQSTPPSTVTQTELDAWVAEATSIADSLTALGTPGPSGRKK